MEKVVDTTLTFEPTPSESARIALRENDKTSRILAIKCIALGVTNIRIIKKIERAVRNVESILKQEFRGGVREQAISSLTLFSWTIHAPAAAPSWAFLRSKRGGMFTGLMKDSDVPEEEKAWHALLNSYNFVGVDEFDLALYDGLRVGFFDDNTIRGEAKKLNTKLKTNKKAGSFHKAWEGYHNSFNNDEAEVLDSIYNSFKRNLETIDVVNLSGTISIFKELGRADQADEMLSLYLEKRVEDVDFWDIENLPFGDMVKDPDVQSAFAARFAELNVLPQPAEVLKRMGRDEGWGPKDIMALSRLDATDFARIFHASKGDDLRLIVAGALRFERIINAGETERSISANARAALEMIGAESAINAKRVEKYGVALTAAPKPKLKKAAR